MRYSEWMYYSQHCFWIKNDNNCSSVQEPTQGIFCKVAIDSFTHACAHKTTCALHMRMYTSLKLLMQQFRKLLSRCCFRGGKALGAFYEYNNAVHKFQKYVYLHSILEQFHGQDFLRNNNALHLQRKNPIQIEMKGIMQPFIDNFLKSISFIKLAQLYI